MAPNPVARFFDQDLEPRAVIRLPVPLPTTHELRNCVCAGRSSKEEHRRTQQSASLSRLPCPPRLRDAHRRKLMQFLLRTIIDGGLTRGTGA